ncbi:rRNA-processing protein UTP23 homolog [Culicoides brevitarsis]|uniref:rRNA-processing protein UTP23 homolog n=1 Tax=Culicoides brevitarsis TaxID=469753 RepID=UPI00307BA0E4
MKINRTKRAQKHLAFFCNNFGFREPYQILIDGTFCFNAIKNNIQIVQQLKKYLQTEIKPLTTACCIIESEQLGNKFQTTTKLLKDFKIHQCGHEKNPIPGSKCFKSMAKKSHYIIATQDRDLQDWIRLQAGIPLIYLHQVAPILEGPSERSLKKVDKVTEKVINVSKIQEERLNFYKKKEGLIKEETKTPPKKRKVKGGPNPLSCKKKKTPKGTEEHTKNPVKNGKVEKKPRKRIKIPKHVKELLTNNSE